MMFECCRVIPMLARVLFMMLLSVTCTLGEKVMPGVIVIQLQSSSDGMKSLFGDEWQKSSGNFLASPGRSAIQTALLFGTPPLQQGVVKDLDWRRKPVATPTLAHIFRKAGYRTQFYGAWALGSSAPYDARSRGFDQAVYFETADRDTLADPWNLAAATPKFIIANEEPNKPLFALIAEGRHLSRAVIKLQLSKWLAKNRAPVVVMVLGKGVGKNMPYHKPAKWYCYSTDRNKIDYSVATDWDLHRALQNMLGLKTEKKPEFIIFHKANWPIRESPEKHRHRGSMVFGNGHVLIDGFRLYPATGLVPDFTQMLDVSKHAEEHQHLLRGHGKWWQQAGKALHNPRAFDVGKADGEITLLTAQDWRTSKIIHADGTALASAPMIYQKNLLEILQGLKSDNNYKESFPAYSGSWAVNIARPGRYKITASLLPGAATSPAEKAAMRLLGGTAHVKLGRNEVKLRLIKGASSVSVKTDADAGVTDLECWFTGQLALTRELGAFFVEIERVGEKKFDLKAK